jgi:hypothetical protein
MGKEAPADDPREKTDHGSHRQTDKPWEGNPEKATAKGRMNDDRSPLLDLMTCIVCESTMRLEKVDPDGEGNDLIQYRCKSCNRTEILRLFRRSRTIL